MYKKILKFRNIMDYIFWKKENSYTRKLRKNFYLWVRIELMTLDVLVWTF